MSDDYKGMSEEAQESYNKRQSEPLFKSARDMIPMEQVKEYYDNLVCGFKKRDGCDVKVRDTAFFACFYHQAMQAVGTAFFEYYNLMTDTEMHEMTSEQHKNLDERYSYMKRWLDNYPRGAQR